MAKLYSRVSDKETILELWGASTKHPDSVYHYSDFAKSDLLPEWHPMQIFQWILECASKLSFPPHAISLASWDCEILKNWMCAKNGNDKAWKLYWEERG